MGSEEDDSRRSRNSSVNQIIGRGSQLVDDGEDSDGSDFAMIDDLPRDRRKNFVAGQQVNRF